MYKVYGHKAATCVQRVLFLLEELSLPYELVHVDLVAGEQKKEDFKKIQPFGKVPVLVDTEEGVTIFESRAILRYLAGKHDQLCGGDTLKDKAIVENWLEVEAHNYNGPISTLVYEKYFKSWFGKEEDPAVVEKSVEELEKVLDVYENVLVHRSYLGGYEFTIVDISNVPYTAYLVEKIGMGHLLEKREHVWDWWNRVKSRPAWNVVQTIATS